ncbi:MAG: aldo/keto reductase, partial [Firmicutes bacterium]|nr:aldo/keto reductase [Bacillota bacterium]
MNYRKLGNTGLMVSEVGFGGEWLERHTEAECVEVIEYARKQGINILDCWMAEPGVRTNIGKGIAGHRSEWIIQGHIGSTWQDGQYKRTRDVDKCAAAFEDLLTRLRTDYIDLGMIHYVDSEESWDRAFNSPYLDYVLSLKASGAIRHIGMSTHNPVMAKRAAESGIVEMLLFSINPAFDLMPPTDNIDNYFAEEYDP